MPGMINEGVWSGVVFPSPGSTYYFAHCTGALAWPGPALYFIFKVKTQKIPSFYRVQRPMSHLRRSNGR